ncbi:MAG: hypothetical protein ABH824_05755 [Nanoarchaeota archaeon]|nr:hypothetical protein [Nanoarchaeota archaeon]MBU1631868.1 hypothetical protein [Nanoarchaeota archaeon]MBU1876073.1 hypothetical protein [Nanoarchaeota archaeon]
MIYEFIENIREKIADFIFNHNILKEQKFYYSPSNLRMVRPYGISDDLIKVVLDKKPENDNGLSGLIVLTFNDRL